MYENLDRDFLIKKADEAYQNDYGEEGLCYTDGGATRFCVIFEELGVVLKRDNGDFYGGYCDREAYLYQKAKEYHIEQIFLPIEYVGNGWFIQPFVKFTEDVRSVPFRGVSHKHEVKFNAMVERMNGVDINPIWLSMVYSYYGWNFFKSFFYFCKRYRVNDLHSGNVCLNKKQPVAYDYSGVPWKGRC